MRNLYGSILMIVLFIFLILIFNSMSDDYDKIYENVTFIAVENTASNEVLYVHQEIYEITDVHIEGIHQIVEDVILSINVNEDGEIVLVNNATGSGDEIYITYSYVTHPTEYTTKFIEVIPLIMLVILLGGLAYLIMNRK